MAAVSAVSAMQGQKANAKQADRLRDQEMAGAKLSFASSQNALEIMKGANKEAAFNASLEAVRVGAAQSRETARAIEGSASTLSSQSEGLTSGRSKGRQMAALQAKGNEVMNEVKADTKNMVNQITDAADKATNDLNNQLFSAWQDMATVLTIPGSTVYQSKPGEILGAAMGGASAGASFGGSFGSSKGAAGGASKGSTDIGNKGNFI